MYSIECEYCGVICDGTATLDHVIPRSKGGKLGTNKKYACRVCNGVKRDMTLEEFKATLYWDIYCKNKIRAGKLEWECGYPPPPKSMLKDL